MRIAVIAWGSLLWQPKNDHGELCVADGDWSPSGPSLPIEFARISSDGRLTLIVLPTYSPSTRTFWRLSGHDELGTAIANLARRETNAPRRSIHAVGRGGVENGSPDPSVVAAIRAWLADASADAAIWTGLGPGPRWHEHGYDGFSAAAAVAYAGSLSAAVRKRTTEYITRAPIETPLRKRLEQALGSVES